MWPLTLISSGRRPSSILVWYISPCVSAWKGHEEWSLWSCLRLEGVGPGVFWSSVILKSIIVLKPLLSSSRSWSIYRVGEDGLISQKIVTRVVTLLPGREFSLNYWVTWVLGSTVGYHGWLGEYYCQSHVLVDDIPVFKKSLSLYTSQQNYGYTWCWRPEVLLWTCCCFCLFVCLFVFLQSRWSHLEGNSRRWVEDGIKTYMCKSCSVSVFFVWHLMSRIPFHQIVSLCKYLLYRGAKYTRSDSLQPETRSWRSFLISFSGRYAQRNIPDK